MHGVLSLPRTRHWDSRSWVRWHLLINSLLRYTKRLVRCIIRQNRTTTRQTQRVNRSPVCVKQPPVLLRQRSRPCVLIVKLVDIRSNRNSQSQLWTKHHWGRYPCRVCTLIIWMNNLSQFYNQHLSCWSRAVSSYYCNCLHSPVASRSRPSPFNGQPDSVTTTGMLVS